MSLETAASGPPIAEAVISAHGCFSGKAAVSTATTVAAPFTRIQKRDAAL
jgi:hypothetical protein